MLPALSHHYFPVLLLSLPLVTPLPSPQTNPHPFSLHQLAPQISQDNCTLPPPFSGEPNPCGCARTSFSSWSWELSDFYFHSSIIFSTPAHQIDGGFVSFTLSHPAVGVDVYECEATSTQLQDWFYGNQEYTCTVKGAAEVGGYGGGKREERKVERRGGDAAMASKSAQFRFDKSSGRVDVNQSWVCSDQDPRWPISFEANGSGHVSLSCNETRYQNANWTSGAIYSEDIVDCAKVNLTIKPSEISAVS